MATPATQEKRKPCGDTGFGTKRRHLAKGGKVEAAGLEPVSSDLSGDGISVRISPIKCRLTEAQANNAPASTTHFTPVVEA